MKLIEAMAQRTSVRSYERTALAPEELAELCSVGEKAEALTEADLRFHLCTDEQIGKEVKGLLGDYGKVIWAPHYVVLSAKESADYLVDAGYRFEQLVLEATRRGVGTCWIGGFFRESTLRTSLGLESSRRMVALTPVGRPSKPGLGGRLIRKLAGSTHRKPVQELFFWQHPGQVLPPAISSDRKYSEWFEAIRWAPSWANKQPWRFVVSEHEVVVYKQTRQVKEDKDYHLLDCGIAMAHLHLAARELGFSGTWRLGTEIQGIPDAEVIARYSFETNRTS